MMDSEDALHATDTKLKSLPESLYCPRDTLEASDHFDKTLGPTLLIKNVHLPRENREDEKQLYHVACRGGRVWTITEIDEISTEYSEPAIGKEVDVVEGNGGLLIPSLCHSHIHLDKCFILDQCDELVTGKFSEALAVTSKAKAQFPHDYEDLFNRAEKLIRESVECGVTSIRSHVEVDKTVKFSCLDVGISLAAKWERTCDIQVVAFAQDPLFSSSADGSPGENYSLLKEAAYKKGVAVVGSAPYVEPTVAQSKRNIDLVLDLAQSAMCHADFHLDYNLDATAEPLIYYVIQQMRTRGWAKYFRGVTIGHATRLGLFTPSEWRELKKSMADLPISIVGLPQSDMYMMGRDQPSPPRATLPITQLARMYEVDIAIAVNNVQNAFTPQGSVDPLSLCTLGVGLFQAGTSEDCRILLRSVTTTSKQAIYAEEVPATLFPSKGDRADFVLLHDSHSVQQAVLSPSYDRTTIRAGKVVAGRRSSFWNPFTTQPNDRRV